ncbi:aldo-keto reductase family protein [Rufibacter roseus]|uniref:STAS/SEC14 domain-containing protein n=1 Tax=Rufibacter roseus TaxID=1567108 RepID=A0ABW2DG47_9BACT|nr:STAS/SEC14 domain-containing protein [Rufibacter roseus]
MIISNKLLHLDYDPSIDVLFVEWPDFNNYSLAELHYTLESLVETIRSYDIKNLLVDATKTVVAIDQGDYEEISGKFAQNLLTTRLQKLARLVSDSSVRERHVENFKKKSNFSFELESFSTKEEALAWIRDREVIS